MKIILWRAASVKHNKLKSHLKISFSSTELNGTL